MGLNVESTLVALNTTTGNQTITITGFGSTPVAAMFELVNATSGAHAAHSSISIGYFVSPNGLDLNYCMGFATEDNVASSNSSRTQSEERCGALYDQAAGSYDVEISGVSFSSNAVVINVDNAGAAVMCKVTLFGGTDIDGIWVAEGGLGTGTTPVAFKCGDDGTNQANFEADLVFATHIGSPTQITGTDNAVHALFSHGIWARADNTQMLATFADLNTATSADIASYFDNAKGIAQAHWGAVSYTGTFAADANGFSIDPSANAGNDIFIFLAFSFSTAPTIELVESTLPSSAVDWTESGFSFTPDWGMSCFSRATVSGTRLNDGSDMAFSLHTFQNDTEVFSVGIAGDDGNTNMNNSQWAKTSFYIGDPTSGTADVDAALQSIQSGGWTVDTGGGTHDSIARKGWSLAIKAAAVGGANPKGPLGMPLTGALAGPI